MSGDFGEGGGATFLAWGTHPSKAGPRKLLLQVSPPDEYSGNCRHAEVKRAGPGVPQGVMVCDTVSARQYKLSTSSRRNQSGLKITLLLTAGCLQVQPAPWKVVLHQFRI